MEERALKPILSLPTEETVIYPESDGRPMAETDTHRNLMADIIQMLKSHFMSHPDVYVSGNLLMYYEKGNPKRSVSPDVFVVFGIEKTERRTYRLWEEGQSPDFVLEIVSKATYLNDLTDKKDLYAAAPFEVKEYFLYDPDKQYLPSPLLGYRLVDGIYSLIRPVTSRLPSQVLGLELGEEKDQFGLYNPQSKEWLLRPAEEAVARKRAEAELARLRAELERLRATNE